MVFRFASGYLYLLKLWLGREMIHSKNNFIQVPYTMTVLDYYSLLHVSVSSSEDEIRKSYKALIKQWHPDTFTGDKTVAELMTRQLNEAYETLTTPNLRNQYDMTVKLQKQERKTGSANSRHLTRSYTSSKGTGKIVTPSYPGTDDQFKKESQRKEREIIDRWMTEVSRYLSEHPWADRIFEALPEDIKLRAMGGTLSFKDVFIIYCNLQAKKISMGLKTSYFNEKLIEKMKETSKSTEEMKVSMEMISREETILQVILRANSGLYKNLKLSKEETDLILKFSKFHDFLNRRPDEFFIGVSKFSVTMAEWKLASELGRMGLKDGEKV